MQCVHTVCNEGRASACGSVQAFMRVHEQRRIRRVEVCACKLTRARMIVQNVADVHAHSVSVQPVCLCRYGNVCVCV